MFRPTQCLERRLRLTTKQVGGGYYKGNRTGSMGHFGKKKGEYIIDWRKVRTYVAPNELDSFHLTPFVSKKMEPMRDEYTKPVMRDRGEVRFPRAPDGKDYLAKWRERNEEEVVRIWRKQGGAEEVKASLKRKGADKKG